MSNIEITVKHKDSSIIYKQSTDANISLSAVIVDGYSKASNQKQFLSTVKELCIEVKKLND